QLVDDANASNGRAARMPGGVRDWGVQFHLPSDAPFATDGPWDCYIVARVDANAKQGEAMAFGLHRGGKAGDGSVARDAAGIEQAAGSAYRTFGLTVDRIEPSMYFWVSPPGDASRVEAVYVDRIF